MSKPTRFSSCKGNTSDIVTNQSNVNNETHHRPEKKVKTARLEYNMDNIRNFVEDRGLNVKWEKSYLCPCRNKKTKVAKMDCPVCHGTGIGYLTATDEKVAIQSQEKGATNMDLGLYDSGTAIGTTYTESNMSFRDRITVPDVHISQSVVFDVTKDRVERGMYLSYKVEYLELVIGEETGNLVEGKDYTFDKKENRFYPKEHLIGTNVSINMQTILRYLIIDLLKESRYQYTTVNRVDPKFENLPRKLLLKREDIFVNPEPFSLESDLTSSDNKVVDSHNSVDPKRKSVGTFFRGIDD